MSLTSRPRKIHFVGIGGIGMSGLAELSLKLGHSVSGSDLGESESVQRLKRLGASVQVGHSAEILQAQRPDVLVYSTAVPASNPELTYARSHKIPIIRRAEMLAELMRLRRGIAIAGSHGKTTTTGLVSLLLKASGLDPTVVIGGRFDAIGSNAAWGDGQWMVAEADESDGSFLRLSPELAVVTNIDREHLDHYKNFASVTDAFSEFIDRVPFYGRVILCLDCEHVRSLTENLRKPITSYGFERKWEPDFLVRVTHEGAFPTFEILSKSSSYTEVWLKTQLSVPGRHNVLNATAAALIAHEVGAPLEKISLALRDFKGVQRRFQLRGEWQGHPVIEDYAHHPTEIRATLEAARSVYPQNEALVIFQPHRFTRTRDQWSDFAHCFVHSSRVLTLPIYAASEPREDWVKAFDGENFAKNVTGERGKFCSDRDDVIAQLRRLEAEGRLAPGCPIFVLGAGDISKLIPDLVG